MKIEITENCNVSSLNKNAERKTWSLALKEDQRLAVIKCTGESLDPSHSRRLFLPSLSSSSMTTSNAPPEPIPCSNLETHATMHCVNKQKRSASRISGSPETMTSSFLLAVTPCSLVRLAQYRFLCMLITICQTTLRPISSLYRKLSIIVSLAELGDIRNNRSPDMNPVRGNRTIKYKKDFFSQLF
jgi:hypothetical protein